MSEEIDELDAYFENKKKSRLKAKLSNWNT